MNMRSSALRTLSAFILSVVTLLTSAQDNSVAEQQLLPVQSLGEVVITANRHGSLSIKTPAAISVTENISIQKRQLRTTPEALLLAPGVFIQKTNHGGGSPFLRGLTGNQTLLLVDGIRLSNATVRYGPNQYFNTIDLFSTEKIEVLRGSGSVQYGSDAIGGTIQAFTRELDNTQDPTWGGTMFSRIATQGMEKTLHGGLSFSARKIAFSGSATWRNFGDLIGGDTTGRQSPTGYRELDFDLKGKIFLSPSSELTMSFQRVHQRDVPVYHKVVLENYAVNKMDPQKRELAYLRLNQKLSSGIFRSAVFTASFQQNEEGRLLQKNGSSLLRTENDQVHSFAFSAEAFTSHGKNWSANSGVEIYSDIVKSRRIDTDLLTDISESKRGLYPDGAQMTSLAIFSMHSFELRNWIITTGARFNSFVNKVSDETVGMTKLTPSAFVGDLSLLRKLTGKSTIFLSLNTGFRAPNIDDLGTLGIVDFRYENPNFNLKPEHSFQYQVGYKFRDQRLTGEIYLYRNELYNLIVRTRMEDLIIEGYPVYQKENVERAYIQGAETAWEKVLSRAWTISGSLTYTYGQNITKNEPVRRIPPLFGRLAAEYKLKRWWINVDWQAAAKQKRLAAGDNEDNRIPAGGTPGWNIFNVSTGYTMRSISFDLSFLNLLNKDYRFHGSGVNGYGRSAFLSVIVTI